MKEYLITIKYPALLIIINSILWHSPYYLMTGAAGDIIFNVFCIIVIAWTGWLLGGSGKSLSVATFTGVLLFFLDHPVITGSLFIMQGQYQAFNGVLVSFVLFAFVPALVAVIGWWLNGLFSGKAPKKNNETGGLVNVTVRSKNEYKDCSNFAGRLSGFLHLSGHICGNRLQRTTE